VGDLILRVNNLCARIGEKHLVKDASFSIYAGDIVLLSGANGSGKSTILKSIIGDVSHELRVSGKINHDDFEDILSLNENRKQDFRRGIVYIPQYDEYRQYGSTNVREIFSNSYEAYSGKELKAAEVNSIIDTWVSQPKEGAKPFRIFDANDRPSRFSGGEQRLLSILAGVTTRMNAKLFIIDEPLNNLDFDNARRISNLLNRVHIENPHAAVLMVTHCRMFPFITRELKLSGGNINESSEPYTWNNCMGEINECKYYSV